MRPIIIGAGRGIRLKAITDGQPKCYAPIGKKRILDWAMEAFTGAGMGPSVFIGGYRLERVRRDYPELTCCENAGWRDNNILASLMHAEAYMENGFVCAYSDILFRDTVVSRALDHPGDIVLCIDTRWRERYSGRTQHPETDAEKVRVENGRITAVRRDLTSEEAFGEYIGVAKFSPVGATRLRDYFHRACRQFAGRPWREADLFEKAYLIHLFQEMIERGETIHYVTTPGDYMEIDTAEDFAIANEVWPNRFGG